MAYSSPGASSEGDVSKEQREQPEPQHSGLSGLGFSKQRKHLYSLYYQFCLFILLGSVPSFPRPSLHLQSYSRVSENFSSCHSKLRFSLKFTTWLGLVACCKEQYKPLCRQHSQTIHVALSTQMRRGRLIQFCEDTQEASERTHLELFLELCFACGPRNEERIDIGMNVTVWHFGLLAKYGLNQRIMNEDILFLVKQRR